MVERGYLFAELPYTPELRDKAFACQAPGWKVCFGEGTIQVIVCNDCRKNISLADALNENDDDIEAAIAASLEDTRDDELAKAIALSTSACQVYRSVGASASSATAVGASSSTAVGASSSTAGGASLEDTPDDELAEAIAASLEGAQC